MHHIIFVLSFFIIHNSLNTFAQNSLILGLEGGPKLNLSHYIDRQIDPHRTFTSWSNMYGVSVSYKFQKINLEISSGFYKNKMENAYTLKNNPIFPRGDGFEKILSPFYAWEFPLNFKYLITKRNDKLSFHSILGFAYITEMLRSVPDQRFEGPYVITTQSNGTTYAMEYINIYRYRSNSGYLLKSGIGLDYKINSKIRISTSMAYTAGLKIISTNIIEYVITNDQNNGIIYNVSDYGNEGLFTTTKGDSFILLFGLHYTLKSVHKNTPKDESYQFLSQPR